MLALPKLALKVLVVAVLPLQRPTPTRAASAVAVVDDGRGVGLGQQQEITALTPRQELTPWHANLASQQTTGVGFCRFGPGLQHPVLRQTPAPPAPTDLLGCANRGGVVSCTAIRAFRLGPQPPCADGRGSRPGGSAERVGSRWRRPSATAPLIEAGEARWLVNRPLASSPWGTRRRAATLGSNGCSARCADHSGWANAATSATATATSAAATAAASAARAASAAATAAATAAAARRTAVMITMPTAADTTAGDHHPPCTCTCTCRSSPRTAT